jgi:hypothetical protein
MKLRTYRFNLFTMHGHLEVGNPDYAELFKLMSSLKGHHHEEGLRQIAIGTAKTHPKGLFLVLYSGDKEKNLLFFDVGEQKEFTQVTGPKRFQARKTRVMIFPETRRVLIEAGRGKISAGDLADIIEDQAHKNDVFRSLELVFTPVAAEEFFTAIDNMTRIQAATVTIAKPNVDWSESYKDLSKLAQDSDAKAIDATVRAKRSAGISKVSGLIPAIRSWVSDSMSSVLGVRIKGEKPNHSGLITLNLSDHVEKVDLSFEVTDKQPEPSDEQIEQALLSHAGGQEKVNA